MMADGYWITPWKSTTHHVGGGVTFEEWANSDLAGLLADISDGYATTSFEIEAMLRRRAEEYFIGRINMPGRGS